MIKDNHIQTLEQAPAFQELDESLYSTLVRQMEYQKNTINLLHLQLKQKNGGDWQKSLEEKDRIISSLEQKLNEKSPENSQKLLEQLEELETENIELETRLREKNEKIRSMEKQYNEHLNRLNNELLEYQKSQGGQSSGDYEKLGSELKIARQQIEVLQQKQFQSQKMQATIDELRARLGNEERLMVENETLRLQLERTELQSDKPALSGNEDYSLVEPLIQMMQAFSSQEYSQLKELLEQLAQTCGISEFDSVGQPFDSARHHISETVFSADLEHNSIFREISKGYMVHGEVFRKANVVLCRNPHFCRSCSTPNIKDSRYCYQCGSKLQEYSDIKETTRSVNDSESSLAYVELGESYLSRRELQLAQDSFMKASILNPKSIQAQQGMILVEESRGNYEECLKHLAKLAELPGTLKLVSGLEKRLEQKMRILDALQSII
ncbi:MAG: nucleotide exchange factor GrpE [Candidatus Cloacimonetes bacterium]|nr:nucleotide exchange factor GrpE [Candidatus Cloacimonadota bacterium]